MKKHEILQAIQLRQSTLKDYLNCPLMFRFKHLDRVTPEFRNPAALHGSTLHRLIYLIHQSKWNMEVSRYYRDIFEELEFGDVYESFIPVKWDDRERELADLESNAIEILEGYRRRQENRDAAIIFSEQLFRVKIAGYIFTGTIDQVRKNPDGSIELLDFKSGKQQPNAVALQNDWQLSLYSYALRHGELESDGRIYRPKLAADFASIYYLRAHEIRRKTSNNGPAGAEKCEPLFRRQVNRGEEAQFRQQLKALVNSMLKDNHYPNPNHCHICHYSNHCLKKDRDIPSNLERLARKRLREIQLTS